jgi:hypothetical protein
MDTQTLVEDQISAGQKFITLLARNNFDVVVACWVRTSDEDSLYLYIASKEVDEKGLAHAYREAYQILQKMDFPWIAPSQIKLVRTDDPIVADIQKTQSLLTDASPKISHRAQLGNISTDEVYIYPVVDPEKVWLRQAFSITYVRQDDTNCWAATTRLGEFYRGVKAKGAVSYTTASHEGERPEDRRFAIVTALVEIDPQFDERSFLEHPATPRMLATEARRMADALFNERHPGAVITD